MFLFSVSTDLYAFSIPFFSISFNLVSNLSTFLSDEWWKSTITSLEFVSIPLNISNSQSILASFSALFNINNSLAPNIELKDNFSMNLSSSLVATSNIYSTIPFSLLFILCSVSKYRNSLFSSPYIKCIILLPTMLIFYLFSYFFSFFSCYLFL